MDSIHRQLTSTRADEGDVFMGDEDGEEMDVSRKEFTVARGGGGNPFSGSESGGEGLDGGAFESEEEEPTDKPRPTGEDPGVQQLENILGGSSNNRNKKVHCGADTSVQITVCQEALSG